MDMEMKEKVMAYLGNQIAQAENRLRAYTVDAKGKTYLKRSAALKLSKYIRDFQTQGKEPRWVAIPGLRGVGKTTLLAQIYTELKCGSNCKIYISLDEAKRVLGVGLKDILSVYEEILEKSFEEVDNQIFIFIDEIQYEENWALILKSLYDRTKKVFIFCTGSSALSLQTNTDVSRRVFFEKLYPMSFTEYMLLKNGKYPIKNLGQNIRAALFDSTNATEVYDKLKKLQESVRSYWMGQQGFEIDNYLRYGSLPFALQYPQEPLIYAQIDQTLTNIVNKDISSLGKFDQATLNIIPRILYAVASASITSLTELSKIFKISINTLSDVFEALEKSEVVLRIYPFGAHFGQVKKPSKYLFLSPAYRSMFFNLIGSITMFDNYKGFLLEDVAGLYLYRIFGLKFGTSLTYDSSEGGADFIITQDKKKIVIEIGYGKKGFSQIVSTMKKIDNVNYGLSIASSGLVLDEAKKSILVPLSYFLLV